MHNCVSNCTETAYTLNARAKQETQLCVFTLVF